MSLSTLEWAQQVGNESHDNFFGPFGDVLLEFSSVKWLLNEDYSFYSNLVGTLLLQNFALDNSYFMNFFVGQTTVEIEGIQKIGIK